MGSGMRKAGVTNVEGKLPTPSLMQRTQHKRSELIVAELEAIALAMFEKRGFDTVRVEEIAAEAQISTRTFYRYFPTKEDVLQVRIRRRGEALRAALAKRPSEEQPLHSLRIAVQDVVSDEDPVLLKSWIAVIAATPNAFRAVLGGNLVATNKAIAEFFASRLCEPPDAVVPQMLASGAAAMINCAQRLWHTRGGNLTTILSQGLRVLEEGMGTDLRGKDKGTVRSFSRHK
jgi:AcrR family transcriptional regulator